MKPNLANYECPTSETHRNVPAMHAVGQTVVCGVLVHTNHPQTQPISQYLISSSDVGS